MHNYSTESKSQRRLFWLRLLGWVMVVIVTILSLISLPKTQLDIPNSDKWLHLLTYFGMTFWFCHIYIKQGINIFLGFVGLGIALELLQSLTPHRYFEWLDMLMNVTGVGLALITFWVFKLRIRYLSG